MQKNIARVVRLVENNSGEAKCFLPYILQQV